MNNQTTIKEEHLLIKLIIALKFKRPYLSFLYPKSCYHELMTPKDKLKFR